MFAGTSVRGCGDLEQAASVEMIYCSVTYHPACSRPNSSHHPLLFPLRPWVGSWGWVWPQTTLRPSGTGLEGAAGLDSLWLTPAVSLYQPRSALGRA